MRKYENKRQAAGVVVLYNPDADVAANLLTYAHDVGRLYVVDNSEVPLPSELETLIAGSPRMEHIRFGENLGIARALNEGARRAFADGYEWLLTMDQDSRASEGMVRRLWEFAVSDTIPRVAIAAARADTPSRKPYPVRGVTELPVVITSGNLLRLAAWHEVGGWEDKLFIDGVDTIFSLALRETGWMIVRINDAVLHHRLGRSELRRFMGVRMVPTHHSALRKYYIARNRVYMHRKYGAAFPDFMRTDRRCMFREFIKLILFEERKWLKIKMSIRGARDGHRGRFGKYQP
jgi:rhamnosyltransferase